MPAPSRIGFQTQTREPTHLENVVSGFVNRETENRQNRRESDALGEIYKKYQQEGQSIDDVIIGIQTNPNISPTARVKAADQALKMKQVNATLQKETQKKHDVASKEILKKQQEQQADDQNEKLLKEAGATAQQLNLYRAAPVGGKTKVIDNILETNERSKKPAGFETPGMSDLDAGLTPSERVKRQDDRFRIQTPLVVENSKLLGGLENEGMSIGLLDELNESGKVGQGVHNLNINPKTGELIFPKAATPEEQLFVKTVNDFTVKAKDTFGARVTNFELDRFLQRLPSLANSEEGRRLILRQMKIINEINQSEKKALQGVFDQYGIRNIDYADAENKARTQINEQKEVLRKEYLNIESLANKEDQAFISQLKTKVPKGRVLMRTPKGTYKHFDQKTTESLIEKGYTPL